MKNRFKPDDNIEKYLKKVHAHFWLTIAVLTVLGGLFLSIVWSSSITATKEQAMKIALAAEASLDKDLISQLRAVPEDIGRAPYETIKTNMINLSKTDKIIRFAYLYTQRDGSIYFIADSEPVSSEDYSPPGQKYTEAEAEDFKPFETGEALVEQPSSDRWGTWVSVLAPIKNSQTGGIIAVLGLDYPVKVWYSPAIRETSQALVIVLAAYILVFTIFLIAKNYTRLKESQTLLHRAHEELRAKEEEYRLLITQMEQGLALHEIICDDDRNPVNYRFISVNEGFEKQTGLIGKDIVGKTVLDVLPKTEKYWIDVFGKVALTGNPCQYENYSSELNKYFSVSVYSPQPNRFATIVFDITEKKQQQEEIEYLSYHDQLTGLYNRRHYDLDTQRLNTERYYPLSLVMADVNGLKLTNDAFGHEAGNELLKRVAEIITNECRSDDIVARIGGDEFVILLPETDAKHAEAIIKRINATIANEKIDNLVLSLSLGFATKENDLGSMSDVFTKAEDAMYRHKLTESSSMRSKTIDLIMSTLYEKNDREMHHSKRVGKLCKAIAMQLGFEQTEVNQTKLAGLMHDIGKIGISELILNKQGKLDDIEWHEMKRHSEIGYRILSSVNEFSRIADYVLEHHERPDGTGYPKGLKGDEISMQARIISIADSYDAMTSERTYTKVFSKKAAIEEIKKCCGTQFDLDIARVFVEKVLGEKW